MLEVKTKRRDLFLEVSVMFSAFQDGRNAVPAGVSVNASLPSGLYYVGGLGAGEPPSETQAADQSM